MVRRVPEIRARLVAFATMLKLLRAGTAEASALLDRSTRMAGDIDERVAQILADVRGRGDEAIAEYTRRFDKREPRDGTYEMSADRRAALAAEVATPVREALEHAAR